jgi:Uri superfamily endonuclease
MTSLPLQHNVSIPKGTGTYALLLRLSAGQTIQIGKLGSFEFPAGHYLYIGSAFGSGGLAGRLGRHLVPDRPGKSPHWHIDYLRRQAPIIAIWFGVHDLPREHDWAEQTRQLPGSNYPAPRFGASDCRCHSHLFHFHQRPDAGLFAASLSHCFPDDEPLKIVSTVSEKWLD